jgi:hypothetical protein
MEERIHELEANIAGAEARISACETALLTFVSADETLRLGRELESQRTELAALMAEWELLSQNLEAAR